MSLELLALTALSPLDGRYGRQTAELRDVFSEFAFMRERLRVEVEWLVNLSMLGLPELPRLPREAEARLRCRGAPGGNGPICRGDGGGDEWIPPRPPESC